MPITKEQETVIVKMHKDGVSITKIGQAVGKSATTIRTWVRVNRMKYGLARRRNLADKCGANSHSVEADCKWDVKCSRIWLSKRWVA